MSRFLINLLVQISNALVYSKKKNYSKRNFLQLSAQWPAGPSDLFGPEQPGKPSRPARPCPPSSLPHQVGSAAASSRAAAVPWTPPLLLPCHGAATVAPLTPPSSIGYNSPPFTPVMAAMKAPITATARHSWPPRPSPNPIKGYPHSGGAPHPFTSPPSLLNRARAVAAWS
jgi:hypothetical protein